MNQEAKLDYLIDYLWKENPTAVKQLQQIEATTLAAKVELFRGLCNIRKPESVSKEFLQVQNLFLTDWNNKRSITSIEALKAVQPQLYLWQGDITSLSVDAIVNAANSEMLGCCEPNHQCIDNLIHTRAGVQLRLACYEIIKEQGRKEAVGKAKITKAYNLPSNYVIHTVGPFIDKRGVTPIKEQLLASSYTKVLALADKFELETIAFCCISTGEFNFPNQRAAEIAIREVKKYLTKTDSKLQVIFNVFKDEDLEIYQSLLTTKE